MARHHSNYLFLFIVLTLTSSCSLFAPTDDELFGKQAGGASGEGVGGGSTSGGESGGVSNGGRSSTLGTGRFGGVTSTSKS
jgi:hypothetical protein